MQVAGQLAELVEQLRPDVVTVDLNMPGLDGVGFIRAQMARRPVPIVVLSIASESGALVMAALDAGFGLVRSGFADALVTAPVSFTGFFSPDGSSKVTTPSRPPAAAVLPSAARATHITAPRRVSSTFASFFGRHSRTAPS